MAPGRRSLFCLWATDPTRSAHRNRQREAGEWMLVGSQAGLAFVPSRSAKDGTKSDLHRDRSDK